MNHMNQAKQANQVDFLDQIRRLSSKKKITNRSILWIESHLQGDEATLLARDMIEHMGSVYSMAFPIWLRENLLTDIGRDGHKRRYRVNLAFIETLKEAIAARE